MAKLDITIAKEAFDALSDELKTFYVATQDGKGYELEGVGSIQRALADEKAKKATKPELLTEIEELRKFKEEQEAKVADAESEKRIAEGKYKEDLEAKEAAWKQRLEQAETASTALLGDVKRERLTNELVKRGVLADRAAYLVHDLDAEIELVKGDSGYQLKKKGGIGDATEFDAVIEAAKAKTPFFFAATNASGSGASGSEGGGGGNAKTMPHAQWKGLSPQEQAAFIKDGGQPVE